MKNQLVDYKECVLYLIDALNSVKFVIATNDEIIILCLIYLYRVTKWHLYWDHCVLYPTDIYTIYTKNIDYSAFVWIQDKNYSSLISLNIDTFFIATSHYPPPIELPYRELAFKHLTLQHR